MNPERNRKKSGGNGIRMMEVLKCGIAFAVFFSTWTAAEVTQVFPGNSNENININDNINNSINDNNKVVAESCQPDKLTVYKVILHTFWTRDKFPKHYPDWRPPAQWSKLIGRSHDSNFKLFVVGKKASKGLRVFAETGRTDILEEQSQGEDGIYDEFTASAIPTGSGKTEAEFFVDGNHSKVSMMSRIVPSPDWFIGIDGLDLCVDGNWVDSITIDADPLDAGTDNGFTFTAPNWPTEPQGIIYRITSRYPSHPAGSFYYPYMKKLPAIATFQFVKIKEYELSEVFHHSEDKDHSEVIKSDSVSQNESPADGKTRNNDIEEEIEEERKEEEMRTFKSGQMESSETKMPSLEEVTTTTTTVSTAAEATTTTTGSNGEVNAVADSTTASESSYLNAVDRGDKTAILNKIVQIYKTDRHKHKLKKFKKYRAPRDCQVSDWSEWGTCSKSCGIGEMKRRREVLKHARRGGRVCPPLLETKWCGSARSCPKKYFKW